ncbi:MAG: hypothetical protein II369_00455, partial [Clostridia bacterium]|nr:hypothetical protein [Clostridia bacterium]
MHPLLIVLLALGGLLLLILLLLISATRKFAFAARRSFVSRFMSAEFPTRSYPIRIRRRGTLGTS